MGWGGKWSISSLHTIRFLLIGNGCTLTAIGLLYLLFVARPSWLVVGSILLAVAIALFVCVPLSDPYRRGR